MSNGAAGITLLSDEFTPVARWRSETVPTPGIAITIAGVRHGPSHNLVVELSDRERHVLAQARDTLVVAAPVSGAAVSDLLLVRSADGPDGTARRSDLTVEHLYGRTIEEGQPVGLVWEVYGLTAQAGGAWHYRVTLEVRDAGGRPLLARLLGGARRSGTILDYDRTAVPHADRTVEWVHLAGEWKAGAYEVALHVQDLVGGGTATAHTTLRVRAASFRP